MTQESAERYVRVGVFDTFFGAAAGGATVAVVIKAYDDYSKELLKAETSIEGMAKKSAVAWGIVAAAAIAAGSKLTEYAIAAAKAGDIQEQFNSVVGIKGVKVLEDMQRETLGTVDKYTLMSAATGAVVRGLDANMLPALTKFSMQMNDAGIATQGVTEVLNDITTAAATGRTGMLARYGINIKEMGSSFSDAKTQGEKLSIIMEKVNQVSSSMAAPSKDAADSVQGLHVAWKEFTDEIGHTAGAATSASAGFFTSLIEGAHNFLLTLQGSSVGNEKMKEARAAFEASGKKALADYQEYLAKKTEDEGDARQRNVDLLEVANGILNGNTAEQQNYNVALQALNAQFESGTMTALDFYTKRKAMDEEHLANLDAELKKQNEVNTSYGRYISIGGGRYVSSSGSAIYSARAEGGYTQTGASNITLHNDFIQRPGTNATRFSPQDTIIGVKDPSSLGGKTVIVNIDSVNGLDPEAIAVALRKVLQNTITT